MSKLVRFEKMLERGFDRLRRKQTPIELLEALPDILDDVEDHLEPSGGRGRVFPYDRVLVALRAEPVERVAARALFQDLLERIQERLRLKGCEPPASLEVKIRFVAEAPPQWGSRRFAVRYRRWRPTAPDAPPPPPRPVEIPAVRLTVVRGQAGQKSHVLKLTRINLGRLEKAASATGRAMRHNHVWFAEHEDTVSRAHAHIERVGEEYRLFDDGSTGGTRLVRDGEEFDVMPNSGRGVMLQDGDRVELGSRCVVEFRTGEPG
jgi:hypothetical protein